MYGFAFDFCYYLTLIFVPIIVFVYFSRDDTFHSSGGLLYIIKYIFGKRAVRKYQEKLRETKEFQDILTIEETKNLNNDQKSDTLSFSSSDRSGNQVNIKLTIKSDHTADLVICLRIGKNVYTLPNQKEKSNIKTRSVSKSQWRCDGLIVEILDPFRRCRVLYNGFLMDVTSKRVQPVKLNFIWNCSSKPNVAWLDEDLDLITHCLAKTKWKDGRWLDLLGDEKGYAQFGALKGQVTLDFSQEPLELNLASVRRRYWGTLEAEALKNYVTIFAATENGRLFHLGVKHVRNGCKNFKFGHVQVHSAAVYPVQTSDLDLDELDHCVSHKMTVHVGANKKIFKLVLTIDKDSVVNFTNNNVRGYKMKNYSGDCTVNGQKGTVIIDYWSFFKGDGTEKPLPLLKELTVAKLPQAYVTTIGSEASKILELTGGKGNSLSLMKTIKQLKIPDGFVVTTTAYDQQVENDSALKNALYHLEEVALGRKKDDLKVICQRTVELFETRPVLPSISQAIKDELMRFKKSHDAELVPFLSWAVRSSALGEDSEEFSSAGQNETYLCCRMDKEVLNKISKCWGSLYSYQSVVYRRQHSLPIRTSMAVVVQQMIPAESAGVLFTCHPSTSDPSKMVITSNFGLGETVVSGHSEPDTIILSRTFDGVVAFESSTLGSKANSMLVSRYGVHQNTLNDDRCKQMSLSEDLAIKLGKLGVLIEEAFGGYRDIEWGVYKGEVYIFQSRPVTTSTQWTDYELTHEFDFAHVSNDTFYTKANIGEVLNCAVSSLTSSTQVDLMEKAYQKRAFGKYDPYAAATITCSHHHCMIELFAGFYMKPTEELQLATSMVDLAVFGRPLLDEELNRKAIERYGITTNLTSLKELLFVIKSTIQASSKVKKITSLAGKSKIEITSTDTPMEIYQKIQDTTQTLIEVSNLHCIISMISVIYQTAAMLIMMEGRKEIQVEDYADLATILSSCNDVISAEVPRRLEEMGEALKTAGLSEEFASLVPEQGVGWLKEKSPETYKLLEEFLRVHGHRALNEMELSSLSWESDPSQVIEMIQMNCRTLEKPKNKSTTPEEVINQLKSPKKTLARYLLKFLIGKHRTAVGNREKSKSALVKFCDNWRKAFRILAKRMVDQGMIPNESLIFHLTSYEILQLIHRKNQSLVQKAMRRQRMYPIWNKLRFPEISYGIPEPEEDGKMEFDAKETRQGTPVCLGDVTGRACVITSLDEIKALKEGDILITKCTDIGWSPYFPIISGIVTELGGLVSHGAVVAREYGLPCLVGVQNATKVFKTGDNVLLSGTRGYIQIVSK